MLVEIIKEIKFNDKKHQPGEIVEMPESILYGNLFSGNAKIYNANTATASDVITDIKLDSVEKKEKTKKIKPVPEPEVAESIEAKPSV